MPVTQVSQPNTVKQAPVQRRARRPETPPSHISTTDTFQMSTWGGIVGSGAGMGVAAVLRVNPFVGLVAGLLGGALFAGSALPRLQESALGRYSKGTTVSAMAGGGALAIAALSAGITSGAVIAGAGVIGGLGAAYLYLRARLSLV